MMRVELTIDELVLEGFDPRDRHRIVDAIQRELSASAWPSDRAGSSRGRDTRGSPGAIARQVRDAIGVALAGRERPMTHGAGR
jgi:hypothetical protein